MLPTRAYTFIFLNAVRVLSITALLLVIASSILTMVHDIQAVNHFIAAGHIPVSNSTATDLSSDYINGSTVPNQPAGAFWAVLNRLLIIGQVFVLLLSELGWPAPFFDRFFPVLGNTFGLGALGVIQCLIGAAILSHHVDTFTLVSAFFLFSLGCLNALAGLIWRERAKPKRALLAWTGDPPVLPTHRAESPLERSLSARSDLEKLRPADQAPPSRLGLGFGRQGEKAAALQGALVSKPVESLPRYAPNTTSPSLASTPTAT